MAQTDQFNSNGAASPEKGRRYHEYQVAAFVRFIHWPRAYRGPIGLSSSPALVEVG